MGVLAEIFVSAFYIDVPITLVTLIRGDLNQHRRNEGIALCVVFIMLNHLLYKISCPALPKRYNNNENSVIYIEKQ